MAGAHHAVTFGGKTSVTIPAGQDVSSDAVRAAVSVGENLLVSVYLPGTPASITWHEQANDTSYVSTTGNHVAEDRTGSYPTTRGSWYFLGGVDVISPTATGTLVAVGDLSQLTP